MHTTHCMRAATGLLSLLLVAAAGQSLHAVVTPPAVRTLELPPGYLTISADDPLLAPILGGATTTGAGPVVHDQVGKTLGLGKTLVTWRDTSDNRTASKYIYLYPYGWQVLGTAPNLRVFEHNGARHILYDRHNRVHVIYNDGVNVWHRIGVRIGGRLQWSSPLQVNDASSPIASSGYGTRGQTFALLYDPSGNVILQCVWSSTWPYNRAILTRRLTIDAAGSAFSGPIVPTGLTGSFQCIAVDSTNTLHLAVELYSAITYMNSADGVNWLNYRTWNATQTGCSAYRFPNLVVDSKDRLHLLWQAEGYLGYGGSAMWWVGLYTMYNPQTAQWSAPSNILAGIPGWQTPTGSQDILFAYPNMLIDDRDNLHVSWHGTARSFLFAWDDIFYLRRAYDPDTDTWGAWTDYAILHSRIHTLGGDGEDDNFSWVPSLAYRPGSDDLYAIFMLGTGDDEVDNPAVNLTDGGLKTRTGLTWQAGYENVTRSNDLRSWYPNAAPTVLVDANGRTWLDMIWIDGTQNDYNVLFRRIDLGGGKTGDCDGDGKVNVFDLQIMARSWNKAEGQQGYDGRADLTGDKKVNVMDLQVMASGWNR